MTIDHWLFAALFLGVFISVVALYFFVNSFFLASEEALDRRIERAARGGREGEIVALRRARRDRRRGPIASLFGGLSAQARAANVNVGALGIVAMWLVLSAAVFARALKRDAARPRAPNGLRRRRGVGHHVALARGAHPRAAAWRSPNNCRTRSTSFRGA